MHSDGLRYPSSMEVLREPAQGCVIRDARPAECQALGALMVGVYSGLPHFPTPEEQPAYFAMLADIGRFSHQPDTRLLVATEGDTLLGGVVYFSDMARYGGGGRAAQELNASGFRLLAVAPAARGRGVGSALMEYCLGLAKAFGHHQVILHTTESMPIAWAMYEKRGFQRSQDLDFMQGPLSVFGFRLHL